MNSPNRQSKWNDPRKRKRRQLLRLHRVHPIPFAEKVAAKRCGIWLGKLDALSAAKKSLSPREFDEHCFRLSKELYQLRLRAEDQPKSSVLRNTLRKAEQDLEALNPYLPRARDVVKAFGKEIVEKPIHDIMSLVIELEESERAESVESFHAELVRDSHLFDCTMSQAQGLYVKRLVKSKRLGIEPSVVTAIERTWQEVAADKREGFRRAFSTSEEGKTVSVVFMPQHNLVLLEELKLKPGSFKAATLATSYFQTKSQDKRGKLVLLQEKEATATPASSPAPSATVSAAVSSASAASSVSGYSSFIVDENVSDADADRALQELAAF